MPRYLLICNCGQSNPVDIGQAGERIACSCGNLLDVPTLRQLRHLPQEKVEAPGAKAAWDTRQGWVAMTLIVVVALLAWSAWTWWKQPKQPKFVAAEYLESVDKNMEKWTPTDALNLWVQYYRPLPERGLRPFQAANAFDIERRISEARFLRGMLLAVTAVFAAIAAAIAFWPKPAAAKRGRRGEGKTGR